MTMAWTGRLVTGSLRRMSSGAGGVGAGGEVGCAVAEPVVLAPAAHPDIPSAAASSTASKAKLLRRRVAAGRTFMDVRSCEQTDL